MDRFYVEWQSHLAIEEATRAASEMKQAGWDGSHSSAISPFSTSNRNQLEFIDCLTKTKGRRPF